MTAPDAAAAGSFAIGGDLPVHRLGFGAMHLSGPTGDPDADEARHAHAVLRRAAELGVTLFDTAPLYGPSEGLIGDAFPSYPDGVVIATKVGIDRTPDGPRYRGRPEQIRADCERSLRRLHLDTIALSQLHDVDRDVPIEESIGGLRDLRDEGKVRHIGVSNVDADELRRAQTVAPIASVQNRYHVGDRGSEDVLDTCTTEGISFLPWRPLGEDLAEPLRVELDRIAARVGATARQVALAWLLDRSPVLCPIPGTSDLAHLEDNIAAAALTLTDDDRRDLDAASR